MGHQQVSWFRITSKYLQPRKDVRILEGGCGNGGVVLALQRIGYTVTGVDYAYKTVTILNKHFPEL